MSTQISRTSIWAAAARALGAREPDLHVRNSDQLAERLLGPEERAILGEDHPLIRALARPYAEAIRDIEAIWPARTLIPRTRFVDSRLEAAINEGVSQVVILGAGFDSRAYRFTNLLRDTRVFEVDQPQTQEVKIRRVRESIGAPPDNLSYVPVDFREQRLGEELRGSGFQAGRPTFFIWEGVTMYLPEDAVRSMFSWIAATAAPGSKVVFDYTYASLIKVSAQVDLDKLPERMKQLVTRFRRLTANEPWIFGLPDQGEKDFLGGLGFELRKVMGMNSAEAVESYLTRADGSVFGEYPSSEQQGYLILEAILPL